MNAIVDAHAAIPPGGLDRFLRERLRANLRGFDHGRLSLCDGQGTLEFGNPGAAPADPDVRVDVLDPSFYLAVAAHGSVGAGEAYMDGHWRCNDLVGLIRLLLRNRSLLDGLESGLARFGALAMRASYGLRRNTRHGSRRNIAAHYDLGNDLFALMLDETMAYSCGVFERDEATLHEAQLAKFERICRKLRLGTDDHLLEIGTGWGGFAIHAASRYGCRVTTTTISREQHDWAKEKIAAAGLADRVTLLLDDYRDLRGRYDKVVSIEMIEAVGARYLDTYTAQCSKLLEPHGAMLLQAITIQDQVYEEALKSVDFIQRFIFPGSFIPSVTAITDSVRSSTDMKVFHLEDIGPHYATTLRRWRENFFAQLPEVRRLGYPDAFVRLWEYYLCYCEGGFLERQLGDVQMLLTKPRCRLPAVI